MAESIYFAHPITDYDTEREQISVDLLEEHGYEVVNPNTPENDATYKERGMQHFVELVAKCDALAFQAFPGGEIGAGVGKEVIAAEERGAPVFEIVVDTLTPVRYIDIEPAVLSVDATRALIKQLRSQD